MKAHYDFSKAKGEKNPYASRLKQTTSIRRDNGAGAYFKAMTAKLAIPVFTAALAFLGSIGGYWLSERSRAMWQEREGSRPGTML